MMKHHQAPPIRRGFVAPIVGSRQHQIILLALRPQGLKASEAVRRGLFHKPGPLLTLMQRLEYDCGLDIRRSNYGRPRHLADPIYYIVGRHHWNGEYEALRQVPDEMPNVRG